MAFQAITSRRKSLESFVRLISGISLLKPCRKDGPGTSTLLRKKAFSSAISFLSWSANSQICTWYSKSEASGTANTCSGCLLVLARKTKSTIRIQFLQSSNLCSKSKGIYEQLSVRWLSFYLEFINWEFSVSLHVEPEEFIIPWYPERGNSKRDHL